MPYVSTGQAAKALGVDRSTLLRWAKKGLLRPALRTPGGHYRWDVEKLRDELRNPSRRRALDEDRE